ncbi:hypothetical protein V8J38_16705 (plasmid) [Brevundimonas olei]|uniref:Lipoprotein n=1 Tax=Brevundimonas olei TaxID=657642 RepID=A0ABZ2IGX4_9CAUL
MRARLCGIVGLIVLAGCGSEPIAVEQPDFSKDPEMQRLVAQEAADRAARQAEAVKPAPVVAPATNADDDPFFNMPASDYQPKTY